MDKKLRRNWIIIAAVVAVAALWLYPAGEKLVLGPDLAGGTTLLYEVDVPDGADPEETLNRVIEVISKRVDPNGVRNLVFQVEAGNRIQILMPHPSPEIVERRKEYQRLLTEVTEGNIGEGDLAAALRAEAGVRPSRLDALVKGVESRKELLARAAEQQDALTAAQEARKAANAEAGSEQDIALATVVAQTRQALNATLDALESTNIDPIALGHALELSNVSQKDSTTGEPQPDSSPRAQALARLYGSHPERKEQVQKLLAAYDAYFSQKRPLEDPNDLIRLLRGQGVLEFRITANPAVDLIASDVNELRATLLTRGPRGVPDDAPVRWYVIDDVEGWLTDSIGAIAENTNEPRQQIARRLHKELADDPVAYFERHHPGLVAGTDGKDSYVLLWNTDDKSLAQRPSQPGWQLSGAGRGADELGRPAVTFQMNETGSSYMGDLTKGNLQRQMAVVLDGRVYSSPVIQSQIRSSGQITGKFSEQDISYLINTLAAGSLQARLSQDPIEMRAIQPTLGAINLERGLVAGGWSIVAVCVFMMGYYFFGGVVASLALLVNLLIILGVMAQIGATFTLAGIAGIILNIGMCIDANVLIFERIREELRRGADMLTALRLGHDKAWSAIIDGNLTTLIVCVLLGWFGTADVAGFGKTLGIGLVATLFTAVFMTHTIFLTWFGKFPRQKMNMLPLKFPGLEKALRPSIDWMAKRKLFYIGSGALSLLGIVLCLSLGEKLFDVEFRAGTEVAFDLTEGQALTKDEVEDALTTAGLPDATAVVVGESDDEGRARQFSVVTPESDSDKVSSSIRQALAGKLDIDPVLTFRGSDKAVPEKEVDYFPVTKHELSEVIGRDVRRDVTGFSGGVALVLEQITPAVTTQEVTERIKAARLQPDFEGQQFRPFEVVGLTADTADPTRFSVVAVLSRDASDATGGGEAGEQSLAASEWKLVSTALTREQSFSKVSRFSPVVARTMTHNAIVVLALSLIAIMAFIWVRFGSLRYGFAAIVALFHDVTLTLGFIAASHYVYAMFGPNPLLIIPFKINMGMIAAILTIIGYSLNDTIVVFDRIRENRGKLAHLSLGVVNDSINQTLSRTFLTGGGVLMSVLLLYIIGGEAIRGFALAMFVGIMAGTYSSIGIASPLLLMGADAERRSDKPGRLVAAGPTPQAR